MHWPRSSSAQSGPSRVTVHVVALAKMIVCVDCGGDCHLISYEPDDGFAPGDVVAYRCGDCLDRWDIEVTADDLEPERPS